MGVYPNVYGPEMLGFGKACQGWQAAALGNLISFAVLQTQQVLIAQSTSACALCCWQPDHNWSHFAAWLIESQSPCGTAPGLVLMSVLVAHQIAHQGLQKLPAVNVMVFDITGSVCIRKGADQCYYFKGVCCAMHCVRTQSEGLVCALPEQPCYQTVR